MRKTTDRSAAGSHVVLQSPPCPCTHLIGYKHSFTRHANIQAPGKRTKKNTTHNYTWCDHSLNTGQQTGSGWKVSCCSFPGIDMVQIHLFFNFSLIKLPLSVWQSGICMSTHVCSEYSLMQERVEKNIYILITCMPLIFILKISVWLNVYYHWTIQKSIFNVLNIYMYEFWRSLLQTGWVYFFFF